MKISIHGATSDKSYALQIMRKHNKDSKTSRVFLLKENIAIAFSSDYVDGFVICSYTL